MSSRESCPHLIISRSPKGDEGSPGEAKDALAPRVAPGCSEFADRSSLGRGSSAAIASRNAHASLPPRSRHVAAHIRARLRPVRLNAPFSTELNIDIGMSKQGGRGALRAPASRGAKHRIMYGCSTHFRFSWRKNAHRARRSSTRPALLCHLAVHHPVFCAINPYTPTGFEPS